MEAPSSTHQETRTGDVDVLRSPRLVDLIPICAGNFFNIPACLSLQLLVQKHGATIVGICIPIVGDGAQRRSRACRVAMVKPRSLRRLPPTGNGKGRVLLVNHSISG